MLSEGTFKHLEREAAESLVGLIGEGAMHWLRDEPESEGVDFVVKLHGGVHLAVEFKRSSELPAIRAAIDQLKRRLKTHPKEVPVVGTSFMGPSGKELCAEAGVGWFDLSGNADVKARGLRLLIEGRPNKFKRAGRPSSVFAPRSSRIARWLLTYSDVGWSQQQLVENTGLDKGYVSRVLKRLRGESLVRVRGEKYYPEDPDLLLRAWQSHYDFTKHKLYKGVVPARSGEEVCRLIAAHLGAEDYAATGLAGAWFLDKFAAFRTSTFYLRTEPTKAFLDRIDFSATEKGANVWLVVPNDEAVFTGRGTSDEGIVTAHWLQVYLDLAAHPERAAEAATHLRESHQPWSRK